MKGYGFGNSKKSAFDSALRSMGLENANIIEISSIIPEGVEEIVELNKYNLRKYGNKVYAVLAYSVDKRKASAGLGIFYDKTKKRGIILEAHGNKKEEVKFELVKGIKDMLEYRDLQGKLRLFIVEKENNSKKRYVCALVIAIFKEEEW